MINIPKRPRITVDAIVAIIPIRISIISYCPPSFMSNTVSYKKSNVKLYDFSHFFIHRKIVGMVYLFFLVFLLSCLYKVAPDEQA